MGFFSKKDKDKPAPATPQWDKPPPGGTAHQRRVAAARREHELMKAISERGRKLGMDARRVAQAQEAAQREIRRRGMGYEQLPPGDPVADFDLYGL
jgi:hypothetical protein